MTQKYRNDFTRCNGDKCVHKRKCERYQAHLEAESLKLERVIYTSSIECVENYYMNLVIKE